MKLNKFKTIAPAVALLLTASLSSCMADLDKGNINPNVDGTPNITGLYSKCYAGLIMEGNDGNADFTIDDAGKSTLLRNLFNFNEIPTDEAICWWSDGGIADVAYNKFDPGNATLKNLYYRLMSNISYQNHFLSLDAAKAEPTKYAEVRVLRAYSYFLMLDFFGDPTFIDKISAETPRQAHAYNEKFEEGKSYTRAELLQMGREFLFNWVENELLAAEPNLLEAKPETDSDPDYGRIDKGTCWLLLSRLYLNAGTYLNNDGQNNPYWNKALEYAEKVINSPYALFDDSKMSADAKANGYKPYDLLFMGDNGSNGSSCEALLPLLQDGEKTHGYGGSMFFVAALWDATMRTVVGKDAATTANTWSGMRVRPQFVEKFFTDPKVVVNKSASEIRAMNVDDRAILWGKGNSDGDRTLEIGANDKFVKGIATPKWNNNYSTTGSTPHDSYNVDIDFFLFRVAEAYLNAAEAEMHINGEGSAKAKGYIDALRNRAHAAVRASYTLNDVLDERSRELYCEGQRRTDLIRFNQFGGTQATYKWELKGGSTNGTTFAKTNNLYPIPSSEILSNKNLTQIDGYNDVQN
ncbi:MAG: RagB/SusD family nutrient uptake outer membrane protein [Prevotella sp.]|uniref:RagB/SusD family nutrient uptake outer membrane protein n=1 Tax=Leyella stercorea TaxID=363265 RepID=UPI001F30A741|nr:MULTISPECIES: RagB/SusD family nutrient uptake outer membrane protein [Prevotellaceae]MCF2579344.1 RagB/SusD family nutrient uptake outer membrane protein [Leyella stercorea]MCI7184155.1 RagB/SusD family nutrient uptake outer membrane protein [Prevotella sp.]